MKITILYHSTTGNTKLVTTYAQKVLQAAGHECEIHDVTASSPLPDLTHTELLGVASPTLYFRGTFTMERVLKSLPAVTTGNRRAFLLATCAGEPGAQFPSQALILKEKGFLTMGAHWTIAPSNWPMQRAITDKLSVTAPIGEAITAKLRFLRLPLSVLWPDLGTPDLKDRAKLEDFLQQMVSDTEQQTPAPRPFTLHSGLPGAVASGMKMDLDKIAKSSAIHINPATCTDCGLCIKKCPEGIICKNTPSDKPSVGSGCTGCYTCYNHCPHGAIHCITAKGTGRYSGPSPKFLEVFS